MTGASELLFPFAKPLQNKGRDMQIGTLDDLFSLEGKIAAITAGGGVLCGAIARGYLAAGATVYLLDINEEKAAAQAGLLKESVADADVVPLKCDVVDRKQLDAVREKIIKRSGRIDILINGAGGNNPKATTHLSEGADFFGLAGDEFQKTIDLNFMGTVMCSQVFGRVMVDQTSGCIVNISSMSGIAPLTNIPAYSAAKAAVINFTKWLAVDMAQNFSTRIRVNSIAPGFFHTEQNHFLLYNETHGKLELTQRGERIIQSTPQGRFGNPEDLVGAAIWLASNSAAFVTGTVLYVDGGFSAYSGV